MIDRPAHLGALEGRDGFVLLLAAAGYGKTTLLQQWEAAEDRRFEWVSAPSDAEAGARLAARLTDAEEPVVVVIDDVHHHEAAGAALIRSLAPLTLPDGVAVAVAGRGLDRRARTRLQLRPDLLELSEAELALDEAQAAAVLGPGASAAGAALLFDRTRGWAAGLQLARRSLSRDGALPDHFTGSDPLVRDFVVTEVLEDLDPDLAQFVLRASVFDEVSGPLCDAALGVIGSEQRLELLERRHVFLTTAGERSLRWHPLVRESLRSELDRREPSAARPLRASGAEWLAAHGAPRQAIALRLADGDREHALRLLADVVLPMFYEGSLDSVVEVIHGIGPDIAVTNGYLATMFAYAGIMTGDDVCARRWSRAATEFYREHGFADVDDHVAFLTLRAHLCEDGVRRMRLDAEAARVRVKLSSPWHAPALMLCGIAAGLCADSGAAESLLDEAIHVSAESGAGPALLLSLAERVEFGRTPGDALARALAQAADPPYSRYPHAALAWALQAESLARAGERSAANRALAAAQAWRPAVGAGMPWLGIQLRLHIARTMAALGEPAGARVVLDEAEDLVRALPDAGVLQTQTHDLRAALLPLAGDGTIGAGLLTTAELRLLPLLPSHLSFEEIGERLHVSRNTIKTQAASVYRKLGVSSRSEAVDHATRLGLVDV
jgi:LuxR family maltose regulon positive regulatory protein